MSKTLEAIAKYEVMSTIATDEERRRVAELEGVLRMIHGEHKAGGRILDLFAKYQQMYGMKGLKRKYYVWLDAEDEKPGNGAVALADGRKMKRGREENPMYRVFKDYFDNNKNNDKAAAYAAMMRDFRSGAVFHFGTWRNLWAKDHPYEAMPDFCPSGYVPAGCTLQNIYDLSNKDPTLRRAAAWSHQGMFAASKNLPPVLRSRVGLMPGQIYQFDDVWHNIDVYAPGVKGVFQPLEFAGYDVASAYKIASLMKPRFCKLDEKTGREVRDNLKEQQFRFLVAYIMCCVGFHKDGVTVIGERGTTRLNDVVLRKVAAVPGWGRLFRFQTSGVMNTPAHKGLLIGNAGGNPRMKALCECSHNILHNATAGLLGNRGRDAAHMHESQAAVVKYSKHMIELAEKIDPALVPFLQLPILEWKKYCEYFLVIENEVMDRHDHHLEGWADKELTEYRLSPTSDWLPVSHMLDMSPEEVAATNAVIGRDPANLMRKRKMSRREAWAAGRKELVKWPIMEATAFLDPRDIRKAKVGRDGTIAFTDALYYPGERKVYLAQYRDRNGLAHNLRPGEEVAFWWVPMGELQSYIWLCDAQGENMLGMAPALKTAAWSDPHSIEVAMGQRQQQIAELMADTRARHAESHVARLAAENVNRALLESAKKAVSADAGANIARIGAEAGPDALDIDLSI